MEISHKEEELLRQLVRENLNEFSLSGLFGKKKKEEPKEKPKEVKKTPKEQLANSLGNINQQLSDQVLGILNPEGDKDTAGLFIYKLPTSNVDSKIIRKKAIEAIKSLKDLEDLAKSTKKRSFKTGEASIE